MDYNKAFEIIGAFGYTYSKTKKFEGFEYRVNNSSLNNDERSESGCTEKFVVLGALRQAGYKADMLGNTQAVHFGI